MSLRPVLVTAPSEPPVDLAAVKDHLRIYHDDDDDLLGAMVEAARSYVDGHAGILGRCLVTQTWRQDFRSWPGNCRLALPMPDVDPESVVITYRDQDDAEQTLSSAMFEVVEEAAGAAVFFRSSFTAPQLASDRRAPIRVTFSAGFGVADDVPQAIKSALLLIVGDLYENRENAVVGQVTVSEMPLGAHTLLAAWRRSGG